MRAILKNFIRVAKSGVLIMGNLPSRPGDSVRFSTERRRELISRSMRSARILVAAAILTSIGCREDISSRYQSRAQVTQFSYITGCIDRTRGDRTEAGYYATMVLREDSTPWLIIAKALDSPNVGFVTESSSDDAAVMVDGTKYVEIPGKTIVVVQQTGTVNHTILDTNANDTLVSLSGGFNDIDASGLEAILPLSEGG